MLKNKHILLGITGSIAAYKSILLVRELVKLGAVVKVVCTPSALNFVTPLTLSTLSKNPVHTSFIANPSAGEWVNHVELGKWADLVLIAPLSASTLSKLSTGQCDNLLLATYLSADCPIFVAPAMDLDMYAHWTTQSNLKALLQKGVSVIESGEGELASGLYGKGRMAEVDEIVTFLADYFDAENSLSGKKVMVTAGPTYEAIDPVRFIGNRSSGKMGIAIANEAAKRGAMVELVIGPTSLKEDGAVANRYDVTSAHEMYEKVDSLFDQMDVLIMSAAVSDYTPSEVFDSKQKKETSKMESIALKPTVDILKSLASRKKNQRLIGFALETDNELENAQKKLKNKNLDMLVLNSLNDSGAGFGVDTNMVTLVFEDRVQPMALKSKNEVAIDIINELENLL